MAASYVDGTAFHHFRARPVCGVQERVLVLIGLVAACGLVVWISVARFWLDGDGFWNSKAPSSVAQKTLGSCGFGLCEIGKSICPAASTWRCKYMWVSCMLRSKGSYGIYVHLDSRFSTYLPTIHRRAGK